MKKVKGHLTVKQNGKSIKYEVEAKVETYGSLLSKGNELKHTKGVGVGNFFEYLRVKGGINDEYHKVSLFYPIMFIEHPFHSILLSNLNRNI